MSTYVVGDIQGCLKPLQCLLKEVDFDPDKDQLWSAGDLINRGDQSLETLRYLYGLGSSFRMVLGNHDLHLLAIYHGYKEPTPKDTLAEILSAPDLDELCAWLLQQPLMLWEGSTILSHAGIPHIWPLEKAKRLAEEVETVLRGEHANEYFSQMYGNSPTCWSEQLTSTDRWRVITNYFTRMRFIDKLGHLNLTDKGPPGTAPDNFQPWFTYPADRPDHYRILFGHWASLEGNTGVSNVVALDTGCVWGGKLRLLELDTGQLHDCRC